MMVFNLLYYKLDRRQCVKIRYPPGTFSGLICNFMYVFLTSEHKVNGRRAKEQA